LIDPDHQCEQGLKGRLKKFKQGPAKNFQPESAEIFFIKVRLKFFTQGLVDRPGFFTTMT